MKYMGSKNRHAKHILPFIYDAIKEINASAYVEPFVGGANMIDKVEVDIPKIANDYHYYLVELFRALQNGWIPPDEISEEEYNLIKANKEELDPELVGFVGFCCSYSGKWWGGYARGNDEKGNPRNYCLESKKNLLNQLKGINGTIFNNGSYIDLDIPDNSVIYCDPPYANTTKYKGGFNHDDFWEWAEIMVELGHKVFVSEYTAPPNWECIWQREISSSLTKDTGGKVATEKLFTLRNN